MNTKTDRKTATLLAEINRLKREQEIEAALERVRAQSMAMHLSQDLQLVVNTVIEQLQELKITLDTTNIIIFNRNDRSFNFWTSSNSTGKLLASSWEVPYLDYTWFKDFAHAFETGQEVFTDSYSGEQKKTIFDYLFTSGGFKDLPDERKKFILDSKVFTPMAAIVTDIAIQVVSYSRRTFSPEEIEIIKRFAKVFKQTYTRFLDLQKAEAQARQAEIELALERVRAKSMAMHTTFGLADVIETVFKQFELLNIRADSCFINIHQPDSNDWNLWVSTGGRQTYQLPVLPYLENPVFRKQLDARKKSVTFYTALINKKAKDQFFDHFFNHLTGLEVSKDRLDYIYNAKGIATSFTLSNHATIALANYSCIPYSDEENLILQRIGNVFEQTYTRFLDLKKAEAQAREAQIEAALERIRARTMGMHKSEELGEVAVLLYTELMSLGMTPFFNCGYVEVDEKNNMQHCWFTTADGELLEPFHLPLTGEINFNNRYKSWKNRVPVFHQIVGGESLKTHMEFLFPVLGSKEVEEIIRTQFPDPTIFYCGNFSDGYLSIVTGTPLTAEDELLFNKFTRVFEMTYKRFLDLKKAEAQAREAQIEAALERIRSASMAMHKSEELPQVALTFLTQIEELAIPVLGVGLAEINKETNTCVVYFADNTEEGQNRELSISKEFEVNEFWLAREGVKRMKSGKKEFTVTAEGERLELWIQWIDKIFSKKRADRLRSANLDKVYFHTNQFHDYSNIIFSSPEPLSEEYRPVIQRLVSTFKLSYLRFLDLQKAEAQSREAEIQLALERVRARTMAMHKSEELAELNAVILQQVRDLNVEIFAAGIHIADPKKRFTEAWIGDPVDGQMPQTIIDHSKDPLSDRMYRGWKVGEIFKIELMEGIKLKTHFKNMAAIIPDQKIFEELVPPNKLYFHLAYFSYGFFVFTTMDPCPQNHDIFKRFAKVFEQTYTRFLDLQKAEAQAREAQIEGALERVRSRSMAMHHSSELSDVASVVFEQVKSLGFEIHQSWIDFVHEQEDFVELYVTDFGGVYNPNQVKLPLSVSPILELFQEWKSGAPFLEYELKGIEVKEWFELLHSLTGDPMFDLKEHPENFYYLEAPNKYGTVSIASLEPINPELKPILSRFAKVFEQTYTRFFDLKKAEAQAREAQIEAALERVRAKALAMQSSGDLIDVAQTLREQMGMLGQPDLESSIIHIYNETANTFEAWYSFRPHKNPTGKFITGAAVDVPIELTEWGKEAFLKYKSKETQYSIISDGEKLKDWYNKVLKVYAANTVEYDDKGKLIVPDVLHYYFSKFSGGALLMISDNQPKPESIELQARAAQVFNFAYQRFLDLKMAEGQAREAQIEVALERIRAKALAMQSSADLHDVSIVLREQMGMLGQPDLESSIVHLYNNSESLESWYTFRSTETNSEKIVTDVAFIPVDSCEYIKETIEKYNSDESEYTIVSKGKKLADWYHVMEKVAPDTIEYDTNGKILIPKILYYHHSKFGGGALLLISNQPPSEESKELQRRAARVFNFAYQRFLDLKKAEEQAHEAKIEASLERVRSQTMAMQHSDDLIHCTTLIFEEFEKLNLSVQRCGIGVVNSKTKDCQLWTTVVTEDGEKEIVTGVLSLSIHPMLKGIFKAWAKRESFLYVLEGKELKDYYKIISKSGFRLPDEVISKAPTLPKQYCYFSLFGVGGLYVFSEKEPTVKEKQIVRRFSEVFNLTYTRYEDLQKAEERAKEATKQASLDRVRGEIASMRSKDDLTRITPLIWHELTVLGVPFIRCGVFIMDNDNSVIQSFLSTPEGKSLGMYNLPYNATEIAVKMVTRWKKGKAYKEHWDKKQFANFIQAMAKRGLIQNQQTYRGDAAPEALDLHFVPFKQGMLYAGNTAPLSEESLQLLKSLAEAFSIAYARYEDFTQLEAAKKQTDRTLEELKSAQTQLIQSEKMASLGELTAGIAHEIQNPLNFVNNFSEVNSELIEELKAERLKLNGEKDEKLEEELLNDLEENENKIRHHGQRASGIVKGMLEHSRTGTRQKELTDMNLLADEYLRLSYHGLRAKDKSFNADFKMESDPSLPKVMVISQDIGRVLLNLINNAFYAVSEKAKKGLAGYAPQVTVKTKKKDHLIEIRVKDNGDGIPPEIINKIFQPFFTTKPTGSGTGLGLSLSYDIVTKGHNGTLEVDTSLELGSEFIIQLPISEKT